MNIFWGRYITAYDMSSVKGCSRLQNKAVLVDGIAFVHQKPSQTVNNIFLPKNEDP